MAIVLGVFGLSIEFHSSIAATDSTLHYFIVFVVSWIAQFVGHKIEGAKPSFLEDLQFLLIGPAWIMNRIITIV